MTAKEVTPLRGDERLYNTILHLEHNTVLHFWRWAFSNLQMNDVRGIFAEWLVAVLLDIPLTIRDSWKEWDLITPEGVTIEVKTSGYLQAWQQKKMSKIVFRRLRGRRLDVMSNIYAEKSTYNADLYVFCVQIEKDARRWDALDLSQWRFYLTSKKELTQLDQDSLSINTLARLSSEMTAEKFQVRAKAAIMEMMKSKEENPTG